MLYFRKDNIKKYNNRKFCRFFPLSCRFLTNEQINVTFRKLLAQSEKPVVYEQKTTGLEGFFTHYA